MKYNDSAREPLANLEVAGGKRVLEKWMNESHGDEVGDASTNDTGWD